MPLKWNKKIKRIIRGYCLFSKEEKSKYFQEIVVLKTDWRETEPKKKREKQGRGEEVGKERKIILKASYREKEEAKLWGHEPCLIL